MNEMKQLNSLNVSVGDLPEWYIEEEHDQILEFAIEDNLHSNPEWSDVYVRVEYHYNGNSTLLAFDEEGDEVINRTIDLDNIFAKIQHS